jgi:hypothetical protein
MVQLFSTLVHRYPGEEMTTKLLYRAPDAEAVARDSV